MKVCWNLTSKCNRNCKFCFREHCDTELSFDECISVLDNLVKLDVTKITFAGGEPLLFGDFIKLTKECKKRGIYNKLNTNGSLLNKNNINDYLQYIDKISFSVDSCNDEDNYFLGRGSNHFKHIKSIIPIIKRNYPQIKIEINTVVTSQTMLSLNNLYNELHDNYDTIISRWKLIRFSPLRKMPKEKIDLFQISDDDFNNLKEDYLNRKSNFMITAVDIDEMFKKSIVNQLGMLETYKNNQIKYKDLKKTNLISKSKYNNNITDGFYLSTNLNLYKVFLEVAQVGNISVASKRMLISQPAISRSIKKLEEELDVSLFYRTINGMSLTDRGKELYGYVEDAYNSIKTGERSMMESQNLYKGKLIVGSPSHIASFYLFDKLKKFHVDYPQVEISIISRSTSDMVKQLENHKLDFVIDTSPIEGNEKILTVEKLTELEHCFVTLSKYNYNINSIRDLEDYPLILPVSHSFHRKKLNDLAFDCDTTFKNVVAIETSEMIRESIVQDLGIGYIIKDVVKREIDNGTMKVLKIEEELPKISLNLVYIDKYLTNIPKLFIDEYLK